MAIKRNKSGQKLVVQALDNTGAPVTSDAANITCKVSKDYGTYTALADTNPTESESGFYTFDLAQGETDAAHLHFIPVTSTADTEVIVINRADGETVGSDYLADPSDIYAAGFQAVGGATALFTSDSQNYLQPQILFEEDLPRGMTYPDGVACTAVWSHYSESNAAEGGIYMAVCVADIDANPECFRIADNWKMLAAAKTAEDVPWTGGDSLSRIFTYSGQSSDNTETPSITRPVRQADGTELVYMLFHNVLTDSVDQRTGLAVMGADPSQWTVVTSGDAFVLNPPDSATAGNIPGDNIHTGYAVASGEELELLGVNSSFWVSSLFGGGSGRTGRAIWSTTDGLTYTRRRYGMAGRETALLGLPADTTYDVPTIPYVGAATQDGELLVSLEVVQENSAGGAAAVGDVYCFVWDAATLELVARPRLAIPRGTEGTNDTARFVPHRLFHRAGRWWCLGRGVDDSNEWSIVIYPMAYQPRQRYEPLIDRRKVAGRKVDLRRLTGTSDARLTTHSTSTGSFAVDADNGLEIKCVGTGGQAFAVDCDFVPADLSAVEVFWRGLKLSEITTAASVPSAQNPTVVLMIQDAAVTGSAMVGFTTNDRLRWSPGDSNNTLGVGSNTVAAPTTYLRSENGEVETTPARDVGLRIDFERNEVALLGDNLTPVVKASLSSAQISALASYLTKTWRPCLYLQVQSGYDVTYAVQSVEVVPYLRAAPVRDYSASGQALSASQREDVTTSRSSADRTKKVIEDTTYGNEATRSAIDGIEGGQGVMLATTIASVTSQKVVVLSAGAPDDDIYNGRDVLVTDASTANQKWIGPALDWDGGELTLTFKDTPGFTIAAGDSVAVMAARAMSPIARGEKRTAAARVLESRRSSANGLTTDPVTFKQGDTDVRIRHSFRADLAEAGQIFSVGTILASTGITATVVERFEDAVDFSYTIAEDASPTSSSVTHTVSFPVTYAEDESAPVFEWNPKIEAKFTGS